MAGALRLLQTGSHPDLRLPPVRRSESGGALYFVVHWMRNDGNPDARITLMLRRLWLGARRDGEHTRDGSVTEEQQRQQKAYNPQTTVLFEPDFVATSA